LIVLRRLSHSVAVMLDKGEAPQLQAAFGAGQSGENEIDTNCLIRNSYMLACPCFRGRLSALYMPLKLWRLR
jgi:hypothetical protein